MRVVFLDRATFGPTVDITRLDTPHEWLEFDKTREDQVVERLAGAQIAITNKVPLRAETLAQLPDLKMISVAATGYDVVDIEACKKQNIRVCNVRGYAINTVPEHTFALLLGLRRSISAYCDDVKNGEWQKAGQFCFFNHPIKDLSGSRLGIIGEGAIGQSVARIATAFGMIPMFAAHKGMSGMGPLYTPWDEVIETSDVISVHAPLTANTRHCLSTDEFSRMQRKPLILNTSRGGLVDEAALVEALDKQQIAGFGFDVLTTEPPSADNPLMTVLDRPNVLLTPHIAWASEEAMTEVWRQTIAHVGCFLAGEPRNVLV
ncbi:D-2-hydroxyacid dehydrogenase [Granulosicoccus antarcticus]|uniref:Glycerate dehydrogenase n=1 Tax=Granulosicoccus antarcticus IMCC3135 TaxID=1192854 RepID=A0A2Z2NS39_9GAMM|nr:D-2-hydroxyacid dehydrogenase [Granulosicoccus antarcticus]ASJ74292.1 Glycerate dehydrogenase [Granulosicoccus antarcticus IMCC3135]